MIHIPQIGYKYRVKPGIVFYNSIWYHHNHYKESIFTVTYIDSKTIFANCNICSKVNEVSILDFNDYFFITASIITIKNTPTKLNI